MNKKIKFSDQPISAKITYSVVIAILTISAIVVAMVSSSSANKEPLPDDNTPPVVNETPEESEKEEANGGESEIPKEEPEAIAFTAPTSGSIMKSHSVETPVFSQTLGDWRVHTGIDIAAEIGADVKAVAGGTVTAVRNDHFMGKTVEVTHDGGIVSVYSNLASEVAVKVGDAVNAGDKLGTVGDTSLTELADESHLHFEILVSGVSVNPLDYISDQSKSEDLGVN